MKAATPLDRHSEGGAARYRPVPGTMAPTEESSLGLLVVRRRALEAHAPCFSGGQRCAAVKRVLGLPAHVRIPAIVAMGRGAEEGFPHHRHPLERIARAA
jgi:hypothetical protein